MSDEYNYILRNNNPLANNGDNYLSDYQSLGKLLRKEINDVPPLADEEGGDEYNYILRNNNPLANNGDNYLSDYQSLGKLLRKEITEVPPLADTEPTEPVLEGIAQLTLRNTETDIFQPESENRVLSFGYNECDQVCDVTENLPPQPPGFRGWFNYLKTPNCDVNYLDDKTFNSSVYFNNTVANEKVTGCDYVLKFETSTVVGCDNGYASTLTWDKERFGTLFSSAKLRSIPLNASCDIDMLASESTTASNDKRNWQITLQYA